MTRIVLVLALLAFATAAHAQPPAGQGGRARPVRVVNDPLAVEVINAPGVQDVNVVNQPAVQDVNVVNESPPPAACPEQDRFQLVGFTSAVFNGDTGILGYAAACQAEFDDSRMCTSVEVMDTVAIPTLSEDSPAWVRAVLQTAQPSGNPQMMDASGQISSRLTCGGWDSDSSSGTQGLAVDYQGRFSPPVCSTTLPVACCAPR